MMALILRAAGSTASEAEVRRCVTIDEAKNEIVEIYHINELSQSDRAEIWLTAQDVMETKKQYTKIVRMMMRSHEPLEETDECCCRGLGKIIFSFTLCVARATTSYMVLFHANFRIQNEGRFPPKKEDQAKGDARSFG